MSASEYIHPCPYCDIKTKSKRGLTRHIRARHKKVALPAIDIESIRRPVLDRQAHMDMLSIPPTSVFDGYIQRPIHGRIMDMDVFTRMAKLQRWCLLYGPTGSGKTLVGMALAAKMRRKFYSINFHAGLTYESVVGHWIPKSPTLPTVDELKSKYNDANMVNAFIARNRQNYEWTDGILTEAFRNGGILDLAEINMCPPSVTSFLFQALDDRRQVVLQDKDNEEVYAHPDLWVIANMNPNYAGTDEMNEALFRRFKCKFFWDYDPSVEKKLLKSNRIYEIGQKLRKTSEIRRDVGTAELMDFEANCAYFGPEIGRQMFVAAFEPGAEQRAVDQALNMEFSSEDPTFDAMLRTLRCLDSEDDNDDDSDLEEEYEEDPDVSVDPTPTMSGASIEEALQSKDGLKPAPVPDVPNCSSCGSKMKLRNGKHGKFYGCSSFPNCTNTMDYERYQRVKDLAHKKALSSVS